MSGLHNVHEVIILNYVELLILSLVMEGRIVIPGKRLSRAINDCDADAYKYLGMLDGDNIKHTEMSYWCLRT